MTILIDSKHIGTALRHSRHVLHLNHAEIAQIMHVSENAIKQYESGDTILSHDQLEQLFTMGLMMMHARRLQYEFNKKCGTTPHHSN